MEDICFTENMQEFGQGLLFIVNITTKCETENFSFFKSHANKFYFSLQLLRVAIMISFVQTAAIVVVCNKNEQLWEIFVHSSAQLKMDITSTTALWHNMNAQQNCFLRDILCTAISMSKIILIG